MSGLMLGPWIEEGCYHLRRDDKGRTGGIANTKPNVAGRFGWYVILPDGKTKHGSAVTPAQARDEADAALRGLGVKLRAAGVVAPPVRLDQWYLTGVGARPLFWISRMAAVDHSRLPPTGVPSIDGIPLACHASLCEKAAAARAANVVRARQATAERLRRVLDRVGVMAVLELLYERPTYTWAVLTVLGHRFVLDVEDGHVRVHGCTTPVPVPKRHKNHGRRSSTRSVAAVIGEALATALRQGRDQP